MSQYEIYKIIEELGGKATTKQIRVKAKEKFPKYTLHLYVSNRLKKLEKNGIIKRYYSENNETMWKIIEKWPF